MSSQVKGDENKMPREGTGPIVPQSYKGMTLEEARLFLRSTMDLFYSLSGMTDLKTMYEAGKQLSRLYFDCAQHQRQLAELLLELDFPGYAIKTMKKLNNMGVFKNDDIWFSSFYFYNICWNYSDASFEFATALAVCGLPNLLSLNIGHKPYLDNLSSRNVYYLIKASLSIIHNICRYPGSCLHFRSESVRASLRNLIDREEDFIRVVASLCLASVVGETEAVSLVGVGSGEGPPTTTGDVLRSIVGYVKKARQSERLRFMGFRSHELLQGIRAVTTTDVGRKRFVNELDGLSLLREGLQPNGGEEEAAECLEIASNIAVGGPEWRSKLIESGIDSSLARANLDNGGRVGSAAEELLWSLEEPGQDSTPIPMEQESGLVPIYVSNANVDRFTAAKIRDRLQTERGSILKVTIGNFGSSSSMASLRRSGIVLVCISEAYKALPRCRLELEASIRMGKTVIGVLVQQKYRSEGWLANVLTNGIVLHDLSSKREFETAWDGLVNSISNKAEELRRIAATIVVKREKDLQQQDMLSSSGGLAGGEMDEPLSTMDNDTEYSRYNGAAATTAAPTATGIPQQNDVESIRSAVASSASKDQQHHHRPSVGVAAAAVLATTHNPVIAPTQTPPAHPTVLPGTVVAPPNAPLIINNTTIAASVPPSATPYDIGNWLERYNLNHLANKLTWLDANSLYRLSKLRKEAPEFCYGALERQLKLDLPDILKLAQALDEIE